MEQSSATAAVDPDRLTVHYFENGGANPQKEEISIVSTAEGAAEDKRCATFSIRNEDHTLGNALRHVIMKKYQLGDAFNNLPFSPDVDFCGYSVPHPSEAKIHLRIQSRGPPAVDILRKGLDDLQKMMEILLAKFEASHTEGNYEHYPDMEI